MKTQRYNDKCIFYGNSIEIPTDADIQYALPLVNHTVFIISAAWNETIWWKEPNRHITF